MVYEEVARRGLHNTEDEKFVREDMRAKEGTAVLAKHIANKTDALFEGGNEVVVLDGLYSWSEYKYLESKYGTNFIVIATTAPKKLRRQRVLDRKDSHRSYTLNVLISREINEIEELEKGGPIAYADYTLANSTNDYEKLYAALEDALTDLKII